MTVGLRIFGTARKVQVFHTMKTRRKKPANQGDQNDRSQVLRVRLPHPLYAAIVGISGGRDHLARWVRRTLAAAVDMPEDEAQLTMGRPRNPDKAPG